MFVCCQGWLRYWLMMKWQKTGQFSRLSWRKISLTCKFKPKFHYTSFPVASLQHKRQLCNKSVTSWRLPRSKSDDLTILLLSDWLRRTLGVASLEPWQGQKWQKSVVSVVSGSLRKRQQLPTCYRLVADLLASFPSTRKLQGSWCNGFWALSCVFSSFILYRAAEIND